MPSRNAATSPKRHRSLEFAVLVALGGALSAWGWLPPHRPVFVVLGLAAIFYSISRAASGKAATYLAFLGAVVFFAIANWPLASAHTWGGWVNRGDEAGRPASWWLMHGLWLLITLWCSLFWTAALLIFRWVRDIAPRWRILVTALGWVFVAEWLRSVSHWGFEWGFLGFALAEEGAIRQWASLGGVLLLSAIVVSFSTLLAAAFATSWRRRLRLVAGGGLALAAVWFGGWAVGATAPGDVGPQRRVAAFQFSPGVPPAGTTAIGIAPDWFRVMPQIAARGYDLVVLPESISSQAVQLDGSVSDGLGAGRQVAAGAWREALQPLFDRHRLFVAVGIEGIEDGQSHNTTMIWGSDGLMGWQHKVHLVPFSEYLPRGWGFLRSPALTYYRGGSSFRPVSAGEFQVGSFICQEVQHAPAVRALVRSGANILITGGNDGVFADRRVALVHHSMAQVRATEVRRFLVRSMKTGVTSIIDPRGNVLGRSPGEESALIGDSVVLRSDQSWFSELGSWPAFVGFVCIVIVGAIRYLQRRRDR